MSHPIIRIKIDVTKIDKARIFEGKKGKYIDVTLVPRKDGADEYGNNYVAIQDVSKEERQAGAKGPILGNAKILDAKVQGAAPQRPRPAAPKPADAPPVPEDDVPF